MAVKRVGDGYNMNLFFFVAGQIDVKFGKMSIGVLY